MQNCKFIFEITFYNRVRYTYIRRSKFQKKFRNFCLVWENFKLDDFAHA